MTAEAIAKMKALGVVADMQPAWLYLDGATLRQQFGNERLAASTRTNAVRAGVIVGGGSDHMQKIGSLRSINPYNPFLGMWTTIVRQKRGADRRSTPSRRFRASRRSVSTRSTTRSSRSRRAEGITRARQARGLHRAGPRYPQLPARSGEGHPGRGEVLGGARVYARKN